MACLTRGEAKRRDLNKRSSASYTYEDPGPTAPVITRHSGKMDASKTKGQLVVYVKWGDEVDASKVDLLFEDGKWKVDAIDDYKP